MRLLTFFLSAMLVIAPFPAAAQSEPNWDDLTPRQKSAVDAPVHSNGGRSATSIAGVGAGTTAAAKGLAAIASKLPLAALGPIGSKILAGGVPLVGGLVLGALTQKFLQGKIEWGPLIASALGSAGAVALTAAFLNPATLPLALAAVAGGVVGEAAYRGVIGMWKDRKER